MDELYRTRSNRDASSDQFVLLDLYALHVVERTWSHGQPSDESIESVRTTVRKGKAHLFHDWDGTYEDRFATLMKPALVRSVVWDLWREFAEWPTWRQVVDRFVSEYGAMHDEASIAAIRAAFTSATGVHAIYPTHLYSPHRKHARLDRGWRWVLDVQRMSDEERRWRLRVALGEEGITHRTFISLIPMRTAA